MTPRLILRLSANCPPAAVRDALAAGDVAAVVLPPTAAAELVSTVQAFGVAGLVEAADWGAARGADGLHLAGAVGVAAQLMALKVRPGDATVGAAAGTRHDAMTLGEAGADYIWFGSVDRAEDEALALAAWWQELFEVPAVIAGPRESIEAMRETGAEFAAVALTAHDDGAALVAACNRALAAAPAAAGPDAAAPEKNAPETPSHAAGRS